MRCHRSRLPELSAVFAWTALGLAAGLTGRGARAADPLRAAVIPVVDRTDLRFVRLSTDDGLSQTRVAQIVQDDRGFLWFGTQFGLNRFDGYKFKVFAHDPRQPGSLAGVYVSALFKDHAGLLWVGCSQCLDRLDPVTEICTHYTIDEADSTGLAGRVVSIAEDPQGMIWLASGSGLHRLDPVTGQVKHFRHDPLDPASLASNDVKSAAFDRAGTLWVGTSEGLEAFDRNTGKVTEHVAVPDPLHLNFYEDAAGTFWIYHTTGSGLATYDRKTHALTSVTLAPDATAPLTGVRAMLEDDRGQLWLGTFGAGLLRYDREGRRFIRYRNNPADSESVGDDDIIALYKDREGNVWLGLHANGPNHFSTQPPRFERFGRDPTDPNGLTTNFIDAFYEDRHGRLWIGTDDALVRVDRQTGKYTRFAAGLGVKPTVVSIAEDRSGSIWIGTYRSGVARLDEAAGRFEVHRHRAGDEGSLSNDAVHRIFVDHAGRLWAGTNDGLDRLAADGQRFDVFKVDPGNRWAQCYVAIAEDRQGILWLGSAYTGLHRFDPATSQFTVYKSTPGNPGSIADDTVPAVFPDDRGAIWVGTHIGLDRFDPATGMFTPCLDSGAALGRTVGCILPDGRGHIWMSTNRGLTEFDPGSGEFRHYSTADGLPGNDLTGWEAGCIGAKGRLYFGGFDGGVAFDPAQVTEDPFVPPVVITEFQLPYAPRPSPAAAALAKGIFPVGQLVLAHDENCLFVEFSALSYFNARTNRYRYRLEGLDPRWNESASAQRSATYTTLPPGSYVFQAQGATARGHWSEPGIVLQIAVLRPWWETWWFLALATAAAAALVTVGLRARIRQADQMRLMRDELARVARVTAMGELTASIAHEVNQPLAAIVTNGQACLRWLNRDVPNLGEIRAGIEQIIRDGIRGGEVVTRIRALVRKQPAVRQPVDLNAVVREISGMLPIPAGVTLELELSPTEPAVLGDRIQLQQVVLNLMSNGVDAMAAVATEGVLRVRTDFGEPGWARVAVIDSGPGVKPEQLARLFEPFFTTKSAGLGLGLSICRTIVEAHGGRLWAESNVAGGMTFRFTLPAMPEAPR